MEITFLGTSSGTPTKTRNVTAIAVTESEGRDWYLIDCGEATQHQLLHTKLSLNTVKAIFITHVHGDHCYGLPGVLASAGMNGRKETLTIVAPKGVREWFEATQKYTELYLPYEVNFIESEHDKKFDFGQFSITNIQLSHRVASFAYQFNERKINTSLELEKLKENAIPQGPLWGMLAAGNDIEYQGNKYKSKDFLKNDGCKRCVIICGDNDNPGLLERYKGCQVLVHESTYTQDLAEKAKKAGHSYAKQVAVFAEKNQIPNLLLTHFSPRYQDNVVKGDVSIESIKTEAVNHYSGNVYLASDFDIYKLDKSGNIEQV